MGAWGVGIFQDDSSVDWIEDAYASGGPEAVRSALEDAANASAGDYLEYDEGTAARAAAEVVASAFGAPPELEDGDTMETLMEHSESVAEDDDLIALALRAIRRVAAENSELHDLWSRAENTASQWMTATEGLETRLRGIQ
ncbi:MAG: DUF4259 domain-containing protein [Tateyamaria sp.]|uniref:DUF4259 domain-containing protein n=1 Tax=Tateyamaria sp. TaxID=1929288 RepID=UPI00329E3161